MSIFLKKHVLAIPLSVDGSTITEVEVRRPKVKDIRKAEAAGQGMDQGVTMVALLTDLPAAVVEEMDAQDFVAVSEIIAGFSNGAASPATGGSPSRK